MNIDVRLAEQNNGTSWRDCERAGLRHRWREHLWVSRETGRHWWHCTRCPVWVGRFAAGPPS